jgi:PAS domain S-box-containing protein
MVASALALRLMLSPWTGRAAPFVLFFGATLVTSLVAGVGPAIMVLLASLPIAAVRFAIPSGSTTGQAAFQALLYAIDGLIVIYLTHAAQSARRRLERVNRELGETAVSLRRTEARAREIVDLAPDAYFQADLEGRFIDVNDAACRLLGYKRAELVGKTILDVIPLRDAARVAAVKAELAVPGAVHSGEWTQLRKDGAAVPVEVSSNILPDGRWQAFVRDIRDRKRAEEGLRQSELKFRRLVESMPDGVFIYQADRIVYANDSFGALLGYEPVDALLGLSIPAFIAPESVEVVRSRARLVLEAGKIVPPREVTYMRRDGSSTVVESVAIGVELEGAPAIVIVVRDLTERRRLEREQRILAEVGGALAATLDYEQTLASVARIAARDFSDWCIVEVLEPSDGLRRLKVVSADPAKAALAGRLERVALARDRPHLTRSLAESRYPYLISRLTPGEVAAVAQSPEHLEVLRAINPVSLMSVPLMVRDELLGTLTFLSSTPSRLFDATDLRLAKAIGERASLAIENARLYRAALHATGLRDQVLGVVAHDLRSPLSSIALHTAALARPQPGPERRDPRPQQAIERAVRRMNRLIQDLLDVAKLEAGRLTVEKAPLLPGPLIEEVVEMHQAPAAASSIDLRVELDPDLPAIVGDRDRLLQVFENLVGNALKFTEAGGRVTVGAARGGSGLLFRVTDTGRGMTGEEMSRAFDRFWQASARSGRLGAGLGLPITKGIVEAHGGRIWIESAPGQGSTFFFSIPAAPPEGAWAGDALH